MLIELEKVSFRYRGQRDWSLREVSLQIEAGEFVVLAGTNGSGKSTLLRLLNGLIPHFHAGELLGRISINGLNPVETSVARLFERVALLAQNPQSQLFSATVQRELAFGLESLNLSYPEIEARVQQAVNTFDLLPLLAKKPASLSGGEQQRVLLAALLALRPEVLALDEPLAALDYAEIRRGLAELQQAHRRGLTVIVAEQRLSHFLGSNPRCLVLERGQLVAEGPARQVFGNPALPATAELLPPVMSLFQQSGLPWRPLDLPEAVSLCQSEGLGLAETSDLTRCGNPGVEKSIRLENVALPPRTGQPPVLQAVNLKLYPGRVAALLGRNGAGKTTLARHLVGLQPPTMGNASYKTRPLYRRKRRIARFWRETEEANLKPGQAGMLFQNPDFQLFLPTVEAELKLGGRLLQHPDPDWLAELITRLGLTPLLERNPFTLSGGEKRRVALASVLATRPELVALDEPTAGLDSHYRQQVSGLLRDYAAQNGSTVVLITHDLELATTIAPHWYILGGQGLAHSMTTERLDLQAGSLIENGIEPPVAARLAASLGQPYDGGPVSLEPLSVIQNKSSNSLC